ncbi:MAG: hypothetical protein EPN75_05565 [Beijerinckiaceae bacterium]|nr:MAG: hypothetical protein EPN75_05565 [Beijerinckiaceae bacterium]
MRTANRKKLIIPPTRRKNEVVPHDGSYVSVCLKFPMPLRLRVFEMVETEGHGPSGTRTVKQARQIGGPDNVVVIKGYNRDGIHLQGGIVNADYAVTKNVPAAFWKLWLEQNADSDLVLNRLIWAHKQEASVVSFIREHESNLSGLEPLQPTPAGSPYGPPPKPVDPRMKGMRMAPTTATHD